MDQTVIFPRYDSYKGSGFDWIGDIPSVWELKRLAAVFEERKEKVSDKNFPPFWTLDKIDVGQGATNGSSLTTLGLGIWGNLFYRTPYCAASCQVAPCRSQPDLRLLGSHISRMKMNYLEVWVLCEVSQTTK